MKYLKMLGLTATAAVALMALAGAGTASATALDDGGGNKLSVPTVVDASVIGGTARFESTSGSVLDTCTGGTLKITLMGLGGAGQTVVGVTNTGDLTWSVCSTTTKTTGGGSFEIHHSIGSNGTVTGTEFEVTINVFGSCTYGLGEGSVHLGTLVGSDTQPSLDINAVITEQTEDKFLCPNDIVWNVEYRFTSPSGLTVTAS